MLQSKACVTVQGGCNLTFKLFYGYDPLVLSCGGEIMLYIVFLMKFLSVATQTEATGQYFPVVLFIFRSRLIGLRVNF